MRYCKRFQLLILILLLSVGNTIFAGQSQFALVVSGGTQSLTVPWHMKPITDRLNPVFVVGAERTLRQGNHIRLYHTANLGFFRHYWWMNGVFLDAELGASYMLPFGFQADLRLGVRYLHYFWRRKMLELRNGNYVHVTDWGKPSLMVPLSVEFGYPGSSKRPLAILPFVSVQWAVQGLFLKEIPVMPHLLILFGVRIPFERIKQIKERFAQMYLLMASIYFSLDLTNPILTSTGWMQKSSMMLNQKN